jgi:hypothetical protein
MHQPNPASAQRIVIAERRAMALALRKQGGSFRKIAETLRQQDGISPKYSEAAAYADVIADLQRLNADNLEATADVRRLELERLDELWQPYFQKARTGDYAALDRCLNIMDRRARYQGLDAPVKVEQSGEVTTVAMTLAEWQQQAEQRRQAAREAEELAGG